MKGSVVMSTKEINQVELFEKLVRKEIKQKEAGKVLHLSVRQVKRKVREYRECGTQSLVHKGRGKTSNNRLNQVTIDRAIRIVKDNYWDFGPTFAHEKLVENHGYCLSISKLRQEMIEVGLWKPKQRKKGVVHQLRERRACFGELVQIDGSPHDWFEGRAPICNLNAAIDDATGRPFLEFTKVETTQGYFSLMEQYIVEHGIPRALYADRHSVFQVNTPVNLDHKKPSQADAVEGLTQFGRAMSELNVELIPANSPEAKGRVEKLNGTMQNRLVKELRIRHISSIKEANHYLPEFVQNYALKFAVPARSQVDMHRAIPQGMDLAKIMCIQEKRVLSKNLTCQYHTSIYQIVTKRSPYALRRTTVTIRERFDGSITIWDNKDKKLEYTIAQKVIHNREIDTKELNQLVDAILIQQAHHSTNPWESSPAELAEPNLFYKPAGAI